MPQGPDGKTIIIVKKVVGHGGGHGGAWKVAYADFVTSMMAFFMVLWLVNSASVQIRERIASYFRAPGVFEKGSGTPVELGGAGILPDAFAPPDVSNAQVQRDERIYEAGIEEGEKPESFGKGGGEGTAMKGDPRAENAQAKESTAGPSESETQDFKNIAAQIKGMIEADKQKLERLLGNIEVSVDQRGLHLEITDTAFASMFGRGSASVVPEAEAEVMRIGSYIKMLPNPVDIEGHTDAVPYTGKIAEKYDNWNLSTDRANAARQMLQKSGVKESQIARVVGYAASRPKDRADARAPKNRRISISMRYTEQAAQTLSGVGAKETVSVPLNQSRRSNVGRKPSSGEKPGLSVEVSTTEPIAEQPVVEIQPEVPTKPLWMEKDRIFDEENPFFGK